MFQKPIPFTREAITALKKGTTLYAVAPKCDGQLTIVTVLDNQLIGKNINDIQLFSISISKPLANGLIIYGEFEPKSNKCYVFDILDNTKTYKSRYTSLTKLCKSLPDFFILKKAVFPKTNETLFKNCKKMLKTDYPNDGLVFTPYNVIVPKDSYQKYPIYKWKDIDHLTGDLLISESNGILVGMAGINKRQFYSLKVKPAEYAHFKPTSDYFPLKFFHPTKLDAYYFRCDNPTKYKDKIVECLFRDNCWVPVLIREDKTLDYQNSLKKGEFSGPNNWKTISDIFEETQNPIHIDELIKL